MRTLFGKCSGNYGLFKLFLSRFAFFELMLLLFGHSLRIGSGLVARNAVFLFRLVFRSGDINGYRYDYRLSCDSVGIVLSLRRQLFFFFVEVSSGLHYLCFGLCEQGVRASVKLGNFFLVLT